MFKGLAQTSEDMFQGSGRRIWHWKLHTYNFCWGVSEGRSRTC